jgi:hypothetical protein
MCILILRCGAIFSRMSLMSEHYTYSLVADEVDHPEKHEQSFLTASRTNAALL